MFGTIPREFRPLANLVDWIAGGGDEDTTLAWLIGGILPVLEDGDFEGRPWLRTAWAHRSLTRSAAYLWAMSHHDWHEEEQDGRKDDAIALEEFARKYAIQIRRCLMEPAGPPQIAEALSTLADVLNQEVGERTAAFIIEMVSEAGLPVYPANALFERVARTEAGKIKPASFTRLLEVMQPRMKEAWRAGADARAFVQGLDQALSWLAANRGPGAGNASG